MRREHINRQSPGDLTYLPVVDELNSTYSTKPKRSIWNTSCVSDGLLYFMIPTSGSAFNSVNNTIVVCNANHILGEFPITLKGTNTMQGACCDGYLGMVSDSDWYSMYVSCYVYDIQNNTLTKTRDITGNNYMFGEGLFALTYNSTHYLFQNANSGRNSLWTFNMDNGSKTSLSQSYSYYAKPFYFTQNNKLIATEWFPANYNDRRPVMVRQFNFPLSSMGTAISNQLAAPSSTSVWKFYDVDDYFYFVYNGYAYTMKGDFTHIEQGNIIPSGFALTYMNLKSGYGYFHNNSTYLFERYKISDYFNW